MDINRASREDLERAFQVDGTRAQYLIDYRQKSGGFKSWDDVRQVPGFEDRMVENLREAGLSIGRSTEGDEPRTSKARSGNSGDEKTQHRPNRSQRSLNDASAEELQHAAQLDGERARYLVSARDRVGGFRSWDDVKREVPSFEDGMVENLQKAGFLL